MAEENVKTEEVKEEVKKEETTNEIVEVVKPSFKERAGIAFRKHGKKVAVVATIGAAFVIGKMLGEKEGCEVYNLDNVIDLNPEDYSESYSDDNQ